jgi:ABC-2 type transport system ATP-binding protein
MNLIEVDNVSKSYGALKAVRDFSMTVSRGEIVALIGPDGAGKTSLFRAICGLITYDSGRISVAGCDVSKDFDKIKPILGYMPQSFSLYPDLSVEENLYFYAGLFGLRRTEYNEKKKRLYEFSGLGPFQDRRAGALSGGMKQKLALSCALVHDPEALILDEPTTGVDPLSRRQFWEILIDLRNKGSSILVSTPYMDEVALSSRGIFIFNGAKLAEGTPSSLATQFRGRVYRVRTEPTYERMKRLNDIDNISCRRFGSSIHLYTDENRTIEDYLGPLARIGVTSDMIESIEPELEDTFIQLMGK